MSTVTLDRDIVIGVILNLCLLRDAEYERFLMQGDPFGFRLRRLEEIDRDLRGLEEASGFRSRHALAPIPRHRALVRVDVPHA